jgi:hypothetical protein
MNTDVGWYKLVPDLIPMTSHGNNLRKILTAEQWRFLKQRTYAHANWKCEICGGAYGHDRLATAWPVECHERFVYDGKTKIQKLVRLVALCKPCHLAQHTGFARVTGLLEDVLLHIMNVNDMSYQEAVDLVNHAVDVCELRSKIEWTLDISVALAMLPPDLCRSSLDPSDVSDGRGLNVPDLPEGQ